MVAQLEVNVNSNKINGCNENLLCCSKCQTRSFSLLKNDQHYLSRDLEAFKVGQPGTAGQLVRLNKAGALSGTCSPGHKINVLNNNITEKEVIKPKFDCAMLLKISKLVRKQLFLLCLLLLVFILGTSVPFLWNRLSEGSRGQPLGGELQSPAGQTGQRLPLLPPHSSDSILGVSSNRRQHSPDGEFKSLSLSLSSVQPLLNNVFISVKTTKKFHYPRLIILLETWVNLVREQTWFFTDSGTPDEEEDLYLKNRTGNHLIYTNCSTSHHRLSLCCKMEAEFEYFLKSHKRWWCHVDDDNYLNPLALAHTLARFDPEEPLYIGKTSTATPLQIADIHGLKNTSFWFATGGAGFCISRTLALKMAPLAVDGMFVTAGNQFWFPDDVTLGYIIDSKLGYHLIEVPEFHSHLEHLYNIHKADLASSITLSYSLEEGEGSKRKDANVVSVQGPFPPSVDTTRFYSVHCYLFGATYCPG